MKLNFKLIRVRLIVSMLLLCLIPLALDGEITYLQAKSILADKLKTTSSQALEEIKGSLDNYFSGITKQLAQASNNINFNQIDESVERDVFTTGYLSDMKKSSNDIVNAFYATESGKYLIYPSSNYSNAANFKTLDWYTSAINNKGQATATDPHVDKASGKEVVTVARAVEYNGKVIGVVGMDMSLNSISGVFSKYKVGDAGYVFISDDKGFILAHPDSSLIGTDTAAKQSFWSEVKTQNKGFAEYTYKGQNKFVVYETQSLTGWKLMASLSKSELNNDVDSIKIVILVSILVAAAAAAFVSVLLGNSIGKNITKLKEGFSKAAAGDLTAAVEIKTKDELGQLGQDFNTMTSNLLNSMLSVNDSSKTILESSSQIAAMADETASAVSEVSRAVDEISTGAASQAQNAQVGAEDIGSLSIMLDDITGLTNEVGTIVSGTEKLSKNGLILMKVLSDKSEQTKQASINVNAIVHDVNDSMTQINSISDTISDITEQTNLLSLNASIEAARAGDSGKGFAVVADEIRKLAEQSKNSTEEIQKIIETIGSKSAVAVNAMERTEAIIEEQDKAMMETRQTFSEIIKVINALTDKINAINDSTSSINIKKEHVVDQIQSISAISEETASATEEVSASAEEVNATMEEFAGYSEQLKSLAEKLQTEVDKFKL